MTVMLKTVLFLSRRQMNWVPSATPVVLKAVIRPLTPAAWLLSIWLLHEDDVVAMPRLNLSPPGSVMTPLMLMVPFTVEPLTGELMLRVPVAAVAVVNE